MVAGHYIDQAARGERIALVSLTGAAAKLLPTRSLERDVVS